MVKNRPVNHIKLPTSTILLHVSLLFGKVVRKTLWRVSLDIIAFAQFYTTIFSFAISEQRNF